MYDAVCALLSVYLSMMLTISFPDPSLKVPALKYNAKGGKGAKGKAQKAQVNADTFLLHII